MTSWFRLPPGVELLGWVLVHFCWEGVLLGAIAWVLQKLLARSTANVRYLVLCGALLACTLAPGLTWLALRPAPLAASTQAAAGQFSPVAAGNRPVAMQPVRPLTLPSLAVGGGTAADEPFPWADSVVRALPCLVLLWCLGVLILSLRLLYGWFALRRLRAGSQPVEDRAWLERIAAVAQRLHCRSAVRLLASVRVEVPTVIGWLKPVLIVPTAFLASLPVNQVEAILAHELAHIRRHDYLVNLLQILIETLLFYHPVVWWLSRAIREEREHCCDDLAVQVTGDRLIYAAALAALEESRTLPFALTLAATGGTLLARIRRVLGVRDPRRWGQSWLAPVAVGGFVIALLATGAFSLAEQTESADPFGDLDLTKLTHDDAASYQNAFRNAVIADKVDLAEAFLRHGIKVDPPDIKSGIGDILGDAAWFSHDPRMIRMLLAHGAKPGGDLHDRNATINGALRIGNKEIADLLIAAGGQYDPVWYDAALGQLDDLKKRDTQQRLDAKQIGPALDLAVAAGCVETFDWLWTKAKTGQADADAKKLAGFYNRAASDGHLPFMVQLEKLGVKPADGGTRALLNAIGGNHIAEAKHLFDLGVPLPPERKNSRSFVGNAAGEGRLEMVRLLLDHNARIDTRDGDDNDRMTALEWAAYEGNDKVCQLLVNRDADLSLTDKNGRTAVWYAAGTTHCAGALALMVAKKAPVPWVDNKGRTLLDFAMNCVPSQAGTVGFPGSVLTPAEQRDYDAREERTIDLLVAAGLNPSGQPGTETPLMTVLAANHFPAARALLRQHADTRIKNAQGGTALTVLLDQYHSQRFPLDLLESFLVAGCSPNESLPIPGLTPATSTTILEKTLGGLNWPRSAQQVSDHRAAVALLLRYGGKFPGVASAADQALLAASAQGDLNAMKAALAQGASPDARETFGYTPLLISLVLQNFDNVSWMLEHGADPTKNVTMWGNETLSNGRLGQS